MHLRKLHRASAAIIGLFAIVHVANHLAALFGVPAHIAFMDAARVVYRHPLAETVLLASATWQVVSGLWLLVSGWRQRRGAVAWLQALSGAVLAFFLLVHVSAILLGRWQLGLDTNFYFAAAGFHVPPFQWYFIPYYFLAVLALFTHLGCAVYWQMAGSSARARAAAVTSAILLGAAASLLIVLSLAGRLQPVDVPDRYKTPYLQMLGDL